MNTGAANEEPRLTEPTPAHAGRPGRLSRVVRRLVTTNPLMWPWLLLTRCTSPVPPGLWLVNVLFQRVLRINGCVPIMVHFTSQVSGSIEVGEHAETSFALSGNCYIQGINGVRIGKDTIFAPGTKIISANHDPADLSKHVTGPGVRVGERCWIGANAVILPGVTLGDDVIVGAGAVVTRGYPDGTVLVGVPAKPIGPNGAAQLSAAPSDGPC